MPSSTTAGSPSAASARYLHRWPWPSPAVERLGTPKYPHHPLQRGRDLRGFPSSLALRPVELLASLADLTGSYFSQPTETFTPELSAGRSPFPWSGITTVATGQFPPAGLSPTGMSARIAAPTPFS